jgi:hypothetical protein
MSVIFDDEIPTPRDTLLLSLAEATGVLEDMLSTEEMRKASKRVAAVVALEEISRAVRVVEAKRRKAMEAPTDWYVGMPRRTRD